MTEIRKLAGIFVDETVLEGLYEAGGADGEQDTAGGSLGREAVYAG